jgi:pyridoxal phosphate enzyme (YggS family)
MHDIAHSTQKLRSELPADVVLVAVSKTKSNEAILEAYQAGQRHFGENRVQELVEKQGGLPNDILWHYIGHVQTNKIKYIAPFVHLIHGVDREKVLSALNKEGEKLNRIVPCLLQVHIAEEDTKFGFSPDELRALLASKDAEWPFVSVRGLMGMATFTDDENQVSREFQGLKNLFDEIQSQQVFPNFEILSMGMSGDYHLALEKGSNMVRIGTTIFGSRNTD